MSAGGSLGNSPLLGAVAVIWSPVRTLRRVAEGRRALPGLVVVSLYAALSLVVSVAFVLGGVTRRSIEQQPPQPGLPPGFEDTLARVAEFAVPAFAVLSPFVVWIVVSLLMQLATRFFGGTGPLSAMLGVVGVAQAPFLLNVLITAVLTGLQFLAGAGTPAGAALGYLVSIVGLAFFLWFLVLVVVGAALARGVGYGESAGSCALSCVGLGVLIILVVIVAAVGIFTTVNAAAP
ncbi:MAG TPA: YIP1 family protein [Rubrobacter sp.]|nr:YIP1 family protein [Rubrobacter sp.]